MHNVVIGASSHDIGKPARPQRSLHKLTLACRSSASRQPSERCQELMTHGRRLPLQCYFGRNGETSPRCVSHIQGGNVYIYNPALPSGEYEIVAFDPSGGLEYNEALFALLVSFNEAGLPFIFRPRSMGEPEHLMEWWQDIGKLEAPYWLIRWRGPGIWYKSLIELPVLGLHGWTGPKKFME